MKQKIVSFLIIVLPSLVMAQRSEMGVLAGISSYKGELNPVLFDSRYFQPGGSLFFRYNFDHHWSLRTNFSFGYIYGDDALSDDEFQKNRNLSFVSSILETAVLLEFNFVPYEISSKKYPFAPYVFAGFGVFNYNPQGYYTDTITGVKSLRALQPLGTEGQGTTQYPDKKEYSLTQFCIPFGMGVKINVGNIGVGLEVGARKTFTDYLDDVSTIYVDKKVLSAQNGDISAIMSDKSLKKDTKPGSLRGNPEDTDWYMFAGLTLSFRLDKRPDGCDSFHRTTSRFFKPDR